jgi:hypothetical protein
MLQARHPRRLTPLETAPRDGRLLKLHGNSCFIPPLPDSGAAIAVAGPQAQGWYAPSSSKINRRLNGTVSSSAMALGRGAGVHFGMETPGERSCAERRDI